ncbi:hypothetical protein N9N82_07660 [Luminiphilus sp.]|nr:hypothetical protein [Luminiphilus sp.]
MGTVKPRKLSKSQKPLKQGGMGFVEVLVASAILALTVAGSVTLLGGWTQALSETRNRTDALVRLISVMDLGKHEIALIDPSDPNYNASLVTGVVSPTQRISGFTVGDITTVAGVNRTKFEASITWLNPYESGADANSQFELHSYHPERRGFVAASSLTAPVCVGAGCSNVDDDCIISTTGTNKGKGKSTKSDGTDCNTTSKTKSDKSYSVKSKTQTPSEPSCTPTIDANLSISVGGNQLEVGASPNLSISTLSPEAISLTTNGPCNVTSSGSPTVTYTNVGTCEVQATQERGCSYLEATATLNIGVISCPSVSPLSISGVQTSELVGNSVAVTLSGGSDFGNTRALTGTPGSVCSVSGSTVSFLAAGTCELTYSQTGVCAPEDAQSSITVTGGSQCVAEQYISGTKTKYRLPDTSACQCYDVNSNNGTLTAAASKSQSSQCGSGSSSSSKTDTSKS